MIIFGGEALGKWLELMSSRGWGSQDEITALIGRAYELILSPPPHPMWGWYCWPSLSQDEDPHPNWPMWHLDPWLPASRIVGDKILFSTTLSLWHFSYGHKERLIYLSYKISRKTNSNCKENRRVFNVNCRVITSQILFEEFHVYFSLKRPSWKNI